MIFGSLFGLALIILLEWLDPWVRSKRDVINIVGVETCVEIPSNFIASGTALDRSKPIGKHANIYRGLSNDMDVDAGFDRQLPIGVISMTSGSGRSTVATNLAITRLMKGQKVLLVDADFRQNAGRRPAENFDLTLSNDGQNDNHSSGPNLFWQHSESDALIYYGTKAGQPINDYDLVELASHNFAHILEPAGRDRFTIVDLPPLSGLEVSLELAGQLDRALIVARSGKTRRDDLKHCAEILNKRGIDCVATVILDVPPERIEGAQIFSFSRLKRIFQSSVINVEA